MNYEQTIIKGKIFKNVMPFMHDLAKENYFTRGSMQDRRVILAHTIVDHHFVIQNEQELAVFQEVLDTTMLRNAMVRHNWLEYLDEYKRAPQSTHTNPIIDDSLVTFITSVTDQLEQKKIGAIMSRIETNRSKRDAEQYKARQIILIKGTSDKYDRYLTLEDIQLLRQNQKVKRIEIYNPFTKENDPDSRIVLSVEQLLEKIKYNQVSALRDSLSKTGGKIVALEQNGNIFTGIIQSADGVQQKFQMNVGANPGQQAQTKLYKGGSVQGNEMTSKEEMRQAIGGVPIKRKNTQNPIDVRQAASANTRKEVQPDKSVFNRPIAPMQQSQQKVQEKRANITARHQTEEKYRFEAEQKRHKKLKERQHNEKIRQSSKNKEQITRNKKQKRGVRLTSAAGRFGKYGGSAYLINNIFDFF